MENNSEKQINNKIIDDFDLYKIKKINNEIYSLTINNNLSDPLNAPSVDILDNLNIEKHNLTITLSGDPEKSKLFELEERDFREKLNILGEISSNLHTLKNNIEKNGKIEKPIIERKPVLFLGYEIPFLKKEVNTGVTLDWKNSETQKAYEKIQNDINNLKSEKIFDSKNINNYIKRLNENKLNAQKITGKTYPRLDEIMLDDKKSLSSQFTQKFEQVSQKITKNQQNLSQNQGVKKC